MVLPMKKYSEDYFYIQGSYIDRLYYSILKGEW